jgi:hypothetical protein
LENLAQYDGLVVRLIARAVDERDLAGSGGVQQGP